VTQVCFVVGHDQDAPEAYWRVLLPARALRADALVAGFAGTDERALQADVIWIHQPTSLKAAALAELGRRSGRSVVVDFSEDPWLRGDVAEPCRPARLEAAERALRAASLIVVASGSLVPAFERYVAPVEVIPPVIPLDAGWDPRPASEPPIIGWWSDGRQRSGFELVAAGLRELLGKSNARIHHYQFAHHAPLMLGAQASEVKARAARLGAFTEGDGPVHVRIAVLRDRFAACAVSLDCYPPGAYADSASDLALLRAAALGIPSVTTRSGAPPGTITAPPAQWAEILLAILGDPERHRGLSLSARSWAETRSTYAAYSAIIEEVLPCLSTT